MSTFLSQQWLDTLQRAGVSSSGEKQFAEIMAAYDSPGRYYHTSYHLEFCFHWLNNLFQNAPIESYFGLWYHDFVYQSDQPGNEFKSAEKAALALSELGLPDLSGLVHETINATKHTSIAYTRASQIVVDIDLLILATDKSTFDAYEINVRREYQWLTDEIFQAGRKQFLKGFLNREKIFQTPECSVFEFTARENILRSIQG